MGDFQGEIAKGFVAAMPLPLLPQPNTLRKLQPKRPNWWQVEAKNLAVFNPEFQVPKKKLPLGLLGSKVRISGL